MDDKLTAQATKNIRDMLTIALEHRAESGECALVLFDQDTGLSRILTEAYRRALPHGQFVDIATKNKEEAIALFDALKPGDLVVLVQSSSFRLDDFRIRLHLFQHKLKVVEHTHLYRNSEAVWDVYIDALAYDPSWYRGVGRTLEAKLACTQRLSIQAGDATLTVTDGLEQPKPNLGDYTGMDNIGGTFPIGEVFTEARDFTRMNGSFRVYAMAGSDFTVKMHAPFRVDVKEGVVVGWEEGAPKDFVDVVANIKTNERPLIREIGFGLNRAITKERYLEDITAFERILGLHLSMGEKHSVYKKEGIATHKSRYHVDIFPVVDRVTADGEIIFENGKYTV